jgi:hypothetical protein
VIPLWWSVLLTAVGVLGIWLAGSRRWQGWALGVAAQGLWIAYAIVTRQWGFIASALVYGFVYGRALYRWRRDEKRVPA